MLFLEKGKKLLIVDNGDDKISSKLYLKGFLERVKETDIDIVGPLKGNGIEKSIELYKKCVKKKI